MMRTHSRLVVLTLVILGVVTVGPAMQFSAGAQEVPSQIVAEAADSVSEPPTVKEEEPAEKLPSLATARQTLRTFLSAMERRDYRTAATALDFSAATPVPDAFQQVNYALRLKAIIDRLLLIDPMTISDEPDGEPVNIPPGEEVVSVALARSDDGKWRVSAETISNLDAIYEVIKDRPLTITQPPTVPVAKPDDESTEPRPTESEDPVDKRPDIQVPDNLKSARRTMRTLLEGLENRDYNSAVSALDLSELDPSIGPYAKLNVARSLAAVIDRMARVDYAAISDDPNGPGFNFPPDDSSQPIEISRNENGIWQFSTSTVARADELYALYKDKPVLNLAETQKPWYQRQLLMGNETWRILALFLSIFVSLVLGQLVRAGLTYRARVLERRQRATPGVIMATLAKTARPLLFLLGLRVGVELLVIDYTVEKTASAVIHIVFVLTIGYVFFRLVDVVVELLLQFAQKSGSTLNNMLIPIVSTSLRLTVIVLVLLEIATAISDQPPSTVVAGLGAGGLALGLAAQDTIKNFFGSVMIYADRPFELGDRIIVDGHDGPVEQVGFRSTRIRTLDGHLVTIPNGEMAHRTIQNIGKRQYIRRVMNIRLPYDTPGEKLRRSLAILRELLANHEGMEADRPPRVFIAEFLDTAIQVRAIYWYHPASYWDYCDYGERLSLQIVERFNVQDIQFALPSQRLFLSGESDGVSKGDGDTRVG